MVRHNDDGKTVLLLINRLLRTFQWHAFCYFPVSQSVARARLIIGVGSLIVDGLAASRIVSIRILIRRTTWQSQMY